MAAGCGVGDGLRVMVGAWVWHILSIGPDNAIPALSAHVEPDTSPDSTHTHQSHT